MEHSAEIKNIALAMAKAQGEFKDAERDRDNPFFGSTYSTMAAVLEACRAALAKNEIAVFQAAEDAEDGQLLVDTMLVHSSGEFFRTKLKVRVMAMKVERADRESNTAAVKAITAQAMGSAQTYACRIALRALVVVASEATDDDDGNAASDIKAAEGKFQDIVVDIRSETKPGKAGGRPWTIHRIDTKEHGEVSTFDAGWAEKAQQFKGTGQQVEIEAKKNPKGYGFDLIGIWPIQAAEDGQGGQQPPPPTQERSQASKAAPAASQPAAPAKLETFRDTIVQLNTKTVAGGPPRYGFLTKEHGWAGTSDIFMNQRISPLNGSGIMVEFKARQNGHGGWDLEEATEVPPASATATPPPAAAPAAAPAQAPKAEASGAPA